MPSPFRVLRAWPLLAIPALLSFALPVEAKRVSARDRAAVAALEQRMQAAEQRYDAALALIANADPKGTAEADAALEDMEDVVDACLHQNGCQTGTLLVTYKRLLKARVDAVAGTDDDGETLLEADDDHAGPLVAAVPEAARAAGLLNDNRHAFDAMVQYNAAIQAGIRRWLTDLRPALLTSYENYENLRAVMWPEWRKRGLPEALLFGIMAKESNGKAHVSSRAGAAGLMQFMPATGRRFGLGTDASGFDTRFDPRSAAEASAMYLNERMAELNDSIELALAAYNGGEGRAARIYRQSGGRGFWDESVYRQFPAETKDYVPMVIAAAWIFLHPRAYGVEFPKVHAQPATLRLARSTTIYELTICLGNAGTRDGYMRALRNFNPRYDADGWIPAGTVINATTRIVGLYNRFCVKGPRADMARALVTANIDTALVRAPAPDRSGSVSVGDAAPVAAPQAAAAPARSPKPRRYTVAKGDTLGRIAARHRCELKTLARANGLRAPAYALRPGQVLTLTGCSK